MFDDIIPSDFFENPNRLSQCHCSDDIRRTGLLFIGQIGPICIFQIHDIHSTAADVFRVPLFERLPAPHQHADTERGVHFMRRERDVVEMFGVVFHLHINGAMRDELRGVNHDFRSNVVRPSRVHVHRVDEPSDIRCTAHCDQFDLRPMKRDFFFEIFFVNATVRRNVDVNDMSDLPPRQLVGMMLHHRRQHDITGLERKPMGKLVNRFGRVLAEKNDAVGEVGVDKFRDRITRFFKDPRRQFRLKTRAAVNV